tara:strand:+ start:8239 stop:10200 length:1962 start_codon:yes stop_codon:yes gene_type:complete
MLAHLSEVYGHGAFRGPQKTIISGLLAGVSSVVIMPTGAGKSLLYQFPATYGGKTSVVISPLISLMNDQAHKLRARGIRAVCLNSKTTVADKLNIVSAQVIYTTPENITSPSCVLWKSGVDIGLFAIDEAHCISQWSHDFRPAYAALSLLMEYRSSIPILAVTATATPSVLEELIEILQLKNCKVYQGGTHRDNLRIRVCPKSEFSGCMFNGQAIVYVQTRKVCENVCASLQSKGILTTLYHGGLSKKTRSVAHNEFTQGLVQVVVATISFGMGIDKADIRQVINYGVPTDIETYYQEIGRAGRDGKESSAITYYDNSDFATARNLINTCPSPEQRAIKHKSLKALRLYLSERSACRQTMLDNYFKTGELAVSTARKTSGCGMCDNCTRISSDKGRNVGDQMRAILEVTLNQHRKKGFGLGVSKTVKLLKNHKAFINFSNKSLKACVEEAITMDVVTQQEVRTKGGRIVMVLAQGSVTPEDTSVSDVLEGRNTVRTRVRKELLAFRFKRSTYAGLPEEIIISDEVIRKLCSATCASADLALVKSSYRATVKHILNSAYKEHRQERMKKVMEHYRVDGKLPGENSSEIAHEILTILESDDTLAFYPDYFGISERLEREVSNLLTDNLGASDAFLAKKCGKGIEPYQIRAIRLMQ